MSILSPVWRAKLCKDIGGGARWQLALDGGEAGLFSKADSKLVVLGSGAAVRAEGGVGGVMALVLMADRYQAKAVQGSKEEAVVGLLTVERCCGVLAWSSGRRLERVARASREVALLEFHEFARTAGFMEVGEEVGEEALGSLLEDNWLSLAVDGGGGAASGVRVLGRHWSGAMDEGLGGGDSREGRGSGLLGNVWFPLSGR